MARQTFYLRRDVRNPLYKTRMLQAGPIELDASAARLYRRLGVELLDEAPRKAAAPAAPETPKAAAPKPPAKKKAPAKRKRKAAAKK